MPTQEGFAERFVNIDKVIYIIVDRHRNEEHGNCCDKDNVFVMETLNRKPNDTEKRRKQNNKITKSTENHEPIFRAIDAEKIKGFTHNQLTTETKRFQCNNEFFLYWMVSDKKEKNAPL